MEGSEGHNIQFGRAKSEINTSLSWEEKNWTLYIIMTLNITFSTDTKYIGCQKPVKCWVFTQKILGPNTWVVKIHFSSLNLLNHKDYSLLQSPENYCKLLTLAN